MMGNAAADRSFVKHGLVVLLLQPVDFLQVFRQHLLVGRDDSFAVFQRRLYDLKRGVSIVDQFNHHVNVRVVENFAGIVNEEIFGKRPWFSTMLYADPFYFSLDACRFFQHMIKPLTDTAESKQTEFQILVLCMRSLSDVVT